MKKFQDPLKTFVLVLAGLGGFTLSFNEFLSFFLWKFLYGLSMFVGVLIGLFLFVKSLEALCSLLSYLWREFRAPITTLVGALLVLFLFVIVIIFFSVLDSLGSPLAWELLRMF